MPNADHLLSDRPPLRVRSGTVTPFGRNAGSHEQLPYRVELWDADKRGVETLVALTASPTIGYAAYFAATRQFPTRMITLRLRGRVLSQWNTAAGTVEQ
jgi:hypothetical protein